MIKKQFIVLFISSIVVMLLFPWAAITFVKSDAGMAIMFLLFFAIDPLYSIVVGYFAGKAIREMWSLPIINAVMFLLGTWIFFAWGEGAFVLYAGVYLALGGISMLSSFLFKARK